MALSDHLHRQRYHFHSGKNNNIFCNIISSLDLISLNQHPITPRAYFHDSHKFYNSIKSEIPNTQNHLNIKNKASYACSKQIESSSFGLYYKHHPQMIATAPQYYHRGQVGSASQMPKYSSDLVHHSPLYNYLCDTHVDEENR